MTLKVLLLIFAECLTTAIAGDYTQNHVVVCSQVPTNSFAANLNFLWGKAILHEIDRYAFLIACPIILVLQLLIVKIFYNNPKLIVKPGSIFLCIVIFEFLLNLHFLVSAIYYTIFSTSNVMPQSFPTFCMVNSIITSFIDVIHIQFLLLFPCYIVYILRFTLKPNSKIWKIIYAVTIVISLGASYFVYAYDLVGLNIFGLCAITFIRQTHFSLVMPIAFLVSIVIFAGLGIFTIGYFKKHMPNTIGLRKKKFQESHILLYYVIGYTLYLLAYLGIEILEMVNCLSSDPQTSVLPYITVFNILRLSQFFYLFLIIFQNSSFRQHLKKFMKKIFVKNRKTDEDDKYQLQKRVSHTQNEQTMNFEQLFLQIKEGSNDINMLRISLVVTLISGIFIAYKQYYNIKDEYFNTWEEEGSAKSRMYLKSTKKIYYHQKMSILINSQIVKDYILDLNLLPRLGILSCNMIIHAPKIFQQLLENDALENIFLSFELHDNSKKMFDLAEGQGGRSGEFFFFSYDNKYVLKTITQEEFAFIDSNLYFFHEHYSRNPLSLLAKIYGLFTFSGNEMQRTYHLILMKNILGCPRDQIIRTYDLKGSKYDRQVAVNYAGENELSTMTLKDIDFMKMETKINIKSQIKNKLRDIIVQDTIFLRDLNLIDYSLLIVKVNWGYDPINPQFWGQLQRIESSSHKDVYYHIGIIDYLQKWGLQKRGEKWWKNMMGKRDISAQAPKKYQQRFMTFVSEITDYVSYRDTEVEMKLVPRRNMQTHKNLLNSQLDHYQITQSNQNYQKLILFKNQTKLQRQTMIVESSEMDEEISVRKRSFSFQDEQLNTDKNGSQTNKDSQVHQIKQNSYNLQVRQHFDNNHQSCEESQTIEVQISSTPITKTISQQSR